MASAAVNVNSSNKKTLTEKLAVQTSLALPRVADNWVENESAELRVLVDREKTT